MQPAGHRSGVGELRPTNGVSRCTVSPFEAVLESPRRQTGSFCWIYLKIYEDRDIYNRRARALFPCISTFVVFIFATPRQREVSQATHSSQLSEWIRPGGEYLFNRAGARRSQVEVITGGIRACPGVPPVWTNGRSFVSWHGVQNLKPKLMEDGSQCNLRIIT